MGKREKKGRNRTKPLHFKGALLLYEKHHVVLVLLTSSAPTLLADMKRWTAVVFLV